MSPSSLVQLMCDVRSRASTVVPHPRTSVVWWEGGYDIVKLRILGGSQAFADKLPLSVGTFIKCVQFVSTSRTNNLTAATNQCSTTSGRSTYQRHFAVKVAGLKYDRTAPRLI